MRSPSSGRSPDIAWLSEAPAGGSLLPGECVSVTVTFDSTGVAPGAYEAELLINNDDPHTPRISLPVEMMVAEVAFDSRRDVLDGRL